METREATLPKDNSVDPAGEFAMNVPDQLLYLLFQAIHHRDSRLGERLASVGLTLARWRTLAVIRRVGQCSMKDLSRYSTIDRTTLTRSVDQLVEAGLVDRHVPPTDRRVVLLTLTTLGEQTYSLAVNLLLDFNREALAGVAMEDQRVMARGLEQILINLIPDQEEAIAVIDFGRTRRERLDRTKP